MFTGYYGNEITMATKTLLQIWDSHRKFENYFHFKRKMDPYRANSHSTAGTHGAWSWLKNLELPSPPSLPPRAVQVENVDAHRTWPWLKNPEVPYQPSTPLPPRAVRFESMDE